MADEPKDASSELESREPVATDLAVLGRALNACGARYLVCGGFAMQAAGYVRHTGEIALLVDASLENEAKVFQVLAELPDRAVLQLEAGEIKRYPLVRVADEIVVDLMQSASGITFEQAHRDGVVHSVDGVPVPFASPGLLWRMKCRTRREKDQGDLAFLRQLFAATGAQPPSE